ncbi:MAG: UDP-N-acetylglucosamine 2-epimerase (non-hydrolyzing) [Methanobacteriaceae archaeon]|jgi:UDP-N-acetylglucosamine 2-epimerase (non-hydrolysing)|nr:UDP-N-acetylglucosamine 2-epimerase (non-hydrolyzing) [Candidatus Methanorudis spinitermitis]
MKIAIVLGTRPEIIKMASVIDEIKLKGLNLVLIHTGQHYDHEMSDQFFSDLELPAPDYNIGVGSGIHGEQTALMLEGIERVLINEKVDILLVQGDTNAVLAGALAASKLHIPVGHVEAGLRSFDDTMPEEINRKVADVCSRFYFVPTEQSAINLSLEGINRNKIFITGNTIVDACFRNLKIVKKKSNNGSSIEFAKINENDYNKDSLLKLNELDNILTLTLHRAENVDNFDRLNNIIDALAELVDMNIIFPIHPRTKKTLENFGLFSKLANLKHVHIIKPVGYLDFLSLLSKSFMVLTDSGGIQEEAITLNIPVLTLRYNTERPETIVAGGNILVGSNKEKILEKAKSILYDEKFLNKMKNTVNPYGNGDSGKKIVDILINSYKNNELKIETPEDIMNSFSTEIIAIDEDTTVLNFEKKNNGNVKVVYTNFNDTPSIKFPLGDLNLKNKFIIFDRYKN